MTAIIRPETANDVEAIARVTEAAFATLPFSSHTEHFIVNALRQRGRLALSLVAEADGEVVGHVAMSPVAISDGTPGWYGLGPLSVAPAWQGKGVGTRLMESAVAGLRQLGAGGCVVLGEPAFYGRFGFLARPELLYPGVPAEYFQALSFSGAFPHGEVRYDEAFAATC
jgi:predicted N-acetyltransferase YhbS